MNADKNRMVPIHVTIPGPANVDGLSDGDRLFIKTVEANGRALIEQTANVAELLGELILEIKDWKARLNIIKQTPPEQAPAEGLRPRENFNEPPKTRPGRAMAQCGYNKDGTPSRTFEGCGADIYWKDQKPYNLDDTVHRCRPR